MLSVTQGLGLSDKDCFHTPSHTPGLAIPHLHDLVQPILHITLRPHFARLEQLVHSSTEAGDAPPRLFKRGNLLDVEWVKLGSCTGGGACVGCVCVRACAKGKQDLCNVWKGDLVNAACDLPTVNSGY